VENNLKDDNTFESGLLGSKRHLFRLAILLLKNLLKL